MTRVEMRVSVASAATATIVTLAALCACRDRQTLAQSLPADASAGALVDACAGDSLRPSAAAPAEGLWIYERPRSRERVAARIGPPRPDDRALAVTRPVETVEMSVAGDTIRHRLAAATVSLELLPAPGSATLGSGAAAGSAFGSSPAATYALTPRLHVAAYEPCATSGRGPRLRYLRRDSAGRIVADVMLRRASDQ